MTELEILIRKRGILKTKLTLFNKFVSNLETTYPDKIIADENLLLELEQRLERILDILNNFDDIQGQVALLCDNINQLDIEQETFESSYYSLTARAKGFLTKNALNSSISGVAIAANPNSIHSNANNSETAAQSTQQNMLRSSASGALDSNRPNQTDSNLVRSETVSHTAQQNVKLPTIELKRFNGNYDGWLEFRDTFDSLIHNNLTINEIQKFHYLRASLEGSASQIIQSLEFSSQNYVVAWKLVRERYDNSRILINNHVKSIFNLEYIREESPSALRKIIDNVTKHLRALQTLKEPTDHWDTLIIYLIVTKLDPTTAREWEETKSSLNRPILDDLKQFLKNRADLLESLDQNRGNKRLTKLRQENGTKSFFASRAYCVICKGGHYIQHCPDFLKLSVNDRFERVKKVKVCTNCLRTGHIMQDCHSSGCRRCNQRHNSLLHFETRQDEPQTTSRAGLQTEPRIQSSTINLSAQNSHTYNSQVLLSTALIYIYDKNSRIHEARILLDAGSQSSFITDDFCTRLGLPKSDIHITVNGLNQTNSNIKYRTTINVKSRVNNYRTQLLCLVVPHISSELPNFRVDLGNLSIPNHIKLADPTFNVPNKIDLLLGADCFWQLTCVGQIQLTQNGLILQKTRFGWVISGPVPSASVHSIQCNLISNFEIDKQLERFWEIEEISKIKSLSQEEKACESHFLENTRRDINGRFVVTIPLKDSLDKLGDSYATAKKRLLSLERKFEINANFKEQYFNFINEYRKLGHMAQVINDNSQMAHYMPHHGVMKESSSTTKLRVVFDASAATSTGISFNNIQMIGPTIQQDLLSLLIRYRKHNFVIASDVEKMYRMVQVNPAQISLQRILWRDDPSKPIDTYELTTITYGTSAAAYLAIRCLYQIGVECSAVSPLVAKVIKNDFYVDDMLSGADTVEEAILLANEVSRELKKGCFNLRKWVTNNPEILRRIEAQDTSNTIDFGCNENTKTLGLIWNGKSDSLLYNISHDYMRKVTKRTILSETSQIFDPLGLLSPCTIIAKIILQNLWSEKLSWDETLPIYIHTKWFAFRDELVHLNEIRIPRQITCKNPIRVELHGFSDAAQHAYGACVYMKCQDQNGEFSVRLVCAKSKVAPIKALTIPRLELSAAVLLANLMEKVRTSLDMSIHNIMHWTDSTIVLGWINTQSNLLQTFVSNRVATIQELTNGSDWRHVSSEDNPADCLSRGITPSALHRFDIYWRGPDWLHESESSWPTHRLTDVDLPELKRTTCSHKATTEIPDFNFEMYSNLTKLERIIAYCIRFYSNCFKAKAERNSGHLTSKEIEGAFLHLVKISQRQMFPLEIEHLSKNKNVHAKSKLLKLNPFLDRDGLIRVGGRLANSNFDYDKKYPIILSAKSNFTKLLFVKEHKRMMHAGPQLLLTTIRDNFWPLQGRNLARKTVHECIRCFRAKPNSITPIMGNLPETRLTPAPPFFKTGVDYAGPFLLKDRKGRGCRVSKCYISIFVCFLTRAIHLELVSDLTKEAFIAALRRFISRRGKPTQMFSDNGTNFVGANSDLQNFGKFLQQNAANLNSSIENEGISWSFIPAHSPHFGGLWEAGVKSTKFHLLRVAGNARMTFEEFATLLAQIEAILNSRPLSPLSSDPSDLTPLTPSHFLIGRIATAAADPDMTKFQENRLSHFQYVQRLQQHFWARWSREYVSELQHRCKWQTNHGALQIDDLVVIKDDNQPPLKWSLGRILRLHPGTDGIARVATIKTASGIIKRSFSKICPLPKGA